MAEGTRLRFNFIEGNLDEVLAVSATDIECSAFVALPVIDHASDGGYAVVVLGGVEIVHVIGHAFESSICTVERGQEGTTATSHATGSSVRHGPTALDYTAIVDDATVMAIALGD